MPELKPARFGSQQVGAVVRIKPEARAKVQAAVLAAVTEIFEGAILPEAQAGSPVRTGHNRDSIKLTIRQVARGVRARLFTTSGHGGYLELGTARMAAEPYLYPAFERHIDEIIERVREKLR